MIKYRLQCSAGHTFEGWFRSSEACDQQMAAGKITCPTCGEVHVSKAPMAPSVAKRAGKAAAAEAGGAVVHGQGHNELARQQQTSTAGGGRGQITPEMLRVMRELRQTVEARAEYVGDRFAEEARRMHYDEVEPRGIYGEASLDEARELAEEGIGFLPLPRLPEDKN